MPPVDFNSKILFIIFIKKEIIDDLKSTFITLNMLFSGQQLNIKTTVERAILKLGFQILGGAHSSLEATVTDKKFPRPKTNPCLNIPINV